MSITERVRRDYARLARPYDRLWRRYLETTVARTLEQLDMRGAERVLDVGCGTGQLLRVLADEHPGLELHGLDLTPQMLGRAKRRLGDAAALLLGSADRLPYADGTFDVVVSSSVLHALSGTQDRAIAEWVRVLRDGGTLVVTDWRADHPGTWARVQALRVVGRGHYRPLSVADLVTGLLAAGVEVDRLETYRAGTWGLVSARGRRRPGRALV